MKTHIKSASLFIVAFIFTFSVNAQTVDEVIAKHIKAHGGQANWDKIESLEITGVFTGFSIQKAFKTVQKKPNLYRWDGGVGKFDVTLVYDGKQGWTLDPWFDVNFERVLNASEQNVVEQKAEICSPFLNYKQKGHKVELIGKEDVDGMEMYHLRLTRKSGNTEEWYLDANSYLEYKYTSKWNDFGYTYPQETYFDDFRNVEGVVIPFYVDRSYIIRNRITEIEKVIVNPDVDENYFNFPISAQMQKLEFLSGNWAVEVMTPSRRGWNRSDSTTITIEQNGNVFQTKFTYENYIRFNKQYTWSYNTESQSYCVTEFNGFSSNMIISEGNGFNADTLTYSNIDIDFANNEKKVFRKYNLIKTSDNNFTIERERSSDEGKTWRMNEKLVFSRVE